MPPVFPLAHAAGLAIALALATLAVLLEPASALPRAVCAVRPVPASPVLLAFLAAVGRAVRTDSTSDEIRPLIVVLFQKRHRVLARHTLADAATLVPDADVVPCLGLSPFRRPDPNVGPHRCSWSSPGSSFLDMDPGPLPGLPPTARPATARPAPAG